MSLVFVLSTLVEVALGLFIIWGFWNEEKVVKFEDKILARLGFSVNRKHKATVIPFKKSDNSKAIRTSF